MTLLSVVDMYCWAVLQLKVLQLIHNGHKRSLTAVETEQGAVETLSWKV